MPWAAGLDLGTTAVKAVLLDPAGRLKAEASRPSPLRNDREIPLGSFLRAATGALRSVLAKAPRGRILLGIASQRSSVVVWDSETGRALGPGLALSWRDRRTPKRWPPRISQAEIIRRTGLRLSPHYGAAKIARLLEGQKPSRTLRAAPLPSWLVWQWSGGRILACDPTLAARLLLWNLEERRWDPVLCRAFGIPQGLLPAVGSYGSFRLGKHELDLRIMIGDQQAAAASLKPGLGMLGLGTGAFLLVPTRGLVRARGLLTTALASGFALEGTVNSAGALFDLFKRKGWGDPCRALPSPSEALGLPACLPALAGTGAPRWDPEARLRFVPPFRDPRSALLAVAYRLREIWEALPVAHRPRKLIAAGGLAACRPLLQAVADLLKVPLIPAGDRDSAALGAALLAQEKTGRIPKAKPILPRDDREAGYRRWRRLLKPRCRPPARPGGGTSGGR